MTNIVQKPDLRVVQVLTGLAGHHGKRYVIPSQATIIHLVHTRTDRRMSRRTLNRHLKTLELQGWIQRIRRHRRGADGQIEMHSTLYHLKRRALAWLHSAARAAARLLKTWRQPVDSSAVTKAAQYERPISTSLSPGGIKPPPGELKEHIERLRRALVSKRNR